jgi:hypothetical protein
MNYQFDFYGGIENNYVFNTDLGLTYVVKFRPSPYVYGSEDVAYSKYIYEFIIGVLI